jgi:predicted DCC family thiol-disulfide oxidoreductase YuxK
VIDGDCGVCTQLGRWAQRRLGVARVEPWQALDLAPLGLDEAACRAAVQYVDAGGRVRAAERAVAAGRRNGPWWARPAGVVLGWPVVRSVAGVVYRVVARYRHRLPGATVSCAVPDRLPDGRALVGPDADGRAAEVGPDPSASEPAGR